MRELFTQGSLGAAEASEHAAELCVEAQASGEVAAFLVEVQRAHPEVPEVASALVRAYRVAGMDEAAEAADGRARTLRRERAGALSDRLGLARVLLTLGQTAEAEAELRSALELSPDEPDALSLFGRVHHMRGELSEAIACWERVRARSPHNENALLSVGILHRLATDPARSRSGAAVVEAHPAARRYLAQMEIERALRHFVEGRMPDCLRVLDRVARRERSRERETYKLAVIARAWVQEASGDVAGACGTLETLGSEAGFGTDLDRLLFLVRLYQRSHDATLLNRAIQVCRYLEERVEKISVLSALARLYERAGDPDRARRYRQRYGEALARRMGRPTLDEVLRAAALRPLRLEDFARFGLDPSEVARRLRDAQGSRERALAALVAGDHGTALEVLTTLHRTNEAGPCELTYLGDLRARAGDVEGAAEAWLAALERAPGSAAHGEVLGRVLSPTVAGEQPRARLSALVADPSVRRESLELLRRAARRAPMSADAWRRLATFESFVGMHEAATRHGRRAAALVRQARPAGEVGHVHSAAAYYLYGRPKGLIHEVWVTRFRAAPDDGGRVAETDLFGNVAPDLRALVRNLCEATRVYVRRRFPHRATDVDAFRYGFKVTKEDEPSSGDSAGLPTAVAFVSVFLGLPVPQDVALTGAVVADAGHSLAVRRVGDIEQKILGAWHKDLRRIVVPAENRPDIEAGGMVPAEVAHRLVVYVRNLDEALEAVFGAAIWDV